jgi:hypothetical protein
LRGPQWGLDYGPDWQPSLDAVRHRERIDDNIRALVDGITYNPFEYSRELVAGEPDERYGTTRDSANGYRVVIFLKVDRQSHRCVLGWVACEDL